MALKRTLGVLTGAGVLVLGGGVVAYAAIPDGDGVFNGCVAKLTGVLRVIDPTEGQRCLVVETPISWNQVGSQGPAGPQGPQGAQGPQGPPGVGASGPVLRVGADVRVPQGERASTFAACEPGEVATGGGFHGTIVADWAIEKSQPALIPEDQQGASVGRPGEPVNGWWVIATPTRSGSGSIRAEVLCMKVR
jgi:hypothetical protein